jgi:actin related protein 2/3 complex subunit 2
MILLEFENRVIIEALNQRIKAQQTGGKVREIDVTVADFDGVVYHLSNPSSDAKTTIQVSIKLDYWGQIQEHDADAFLKDLYGAYLVDAESGYDITLLMDVATIAPAEADTIVSKFASLKRNCFAAVFHKYFKLQAAGGAGVDGSPSCIKYRPQETMFISAHRDRVTVVFSTMFTDEDDVVIGKLFLQEFQEARKKNQAAPQVIFKHKSPPDELATFPEALTGDNVGYVTFVLFPRHIDAKCAENTIDLVHTFRDYLHYHLKCSKAYLHMRMRAQSANLLKILNRAKPANDKKGTKTMSGRSFVRK